MLNIDREKRIMLYDKISEVILSECVYTFNIADRDIISLTVMVGDNVLSIMLASFPPEHETTEPINVLMFNDYTKSYAIQLRKDADDVYDRLTEQVHTFIGYTDVAYDDRLWITEEIIEVCSITEVFGCGYVM